MSHLMGGAAPRDAGEVAGDGASALLDERVTKSTQRLSSAGVSVYAVREPCVSALLCALSRELPHTKPAPALEKRCLLGVARPLTRCACACSYCLPCTTPFMPWTMPRALQDASGVVRADLSFDRVGYHDLAVRVGEKVMLASRLARSSSRVSSSPIAAELRTTEMIEEGGGRMRSQCVAISTLDHSMRSNNYPAL
eukprot:6174308-Pleurochrysis_carterae.AAC.2